MMDEESDYSFYVLVKRIPFSFYEMDYYLQRDDEVDFGEHPLDDTECYLTFYDDNVSFGYYEGYWREVCNDSRCWTLRGNTVEELMEEIEKHGSHHLLSQLEGVYVKKITNYW